MVTLVLAEDVRAIVEQQPYRSNAAVRASVAGLDVVTLDAAGMALMRVSVARPSSLHVPLMST